MLARFNNKEVLDIDYAATKQALVLRPWPSMLLLQQ
jgi:hypothetical protein